MFSIVICCTKLWEQQRTHIVSHEHACVFKVMSRVFLKQPSSPTPWLASSMKTAATCTCPWCVCLCVLEHAKNTWTLLDRIACLSWAHILFDAAQIALIHAINIHSWIINAHVLIRKACWLDFDAIYCIYIFSVCLYLWLHACAHIESMVAWKTCNIQP